jgi:aspartate aminotransferase
VHSPEGGFYLFPDFSQLSEQLASKGIATSNAMTQSLLAETGVSLLPGSAFGMPASSLTARLAYVDFDGGAALVEKDAAVHQVEKGIDSLCRWLDT